MHTSHQSEVQIKKIERQKLENYNCIHVPFRIIKFTQDTKYSLKTNSFTGIQEKLIEYRIKLRLDVWTFCTHKHFRYHLNIIQNYSSELKLQSEGKTLDSVKKMYHLELELWPQYDTI